MTHKGFLIYDESDNNDPNSDTYEDSIGSAQYTERNRDAEDVSYTINENESVLLINEEEKTTNM